MFAFVVLISLIVRPQLLSKVILILQRSVATMGNGGNKGEPRFFADFQISVCRDAFKFLSSVFHEVYTIAFSLK